MTAFFTSYMVPLLTGAFVGALFTVAKLPLPAPPTIGGVLGIAGVWLGYMAVSRFWQ